MFNNGSLVPISLEHMNLVVDLSNRRLVDGFTSLKARVDLAATQHIRIFTVSHHFSPSSEFSSILLQDFPPLLKTCSSHISVIHNVEHNTETSGAPTFARPRLLASERVKVARAEICHMLELGINQPSKSVEFSLASRPQ